MNTRVRYPIPFRIVASNTVPRRGMGNAENTCAPGDFASMKQISFCMLL